MRHDSNPSEVLVRLWELDRRVVAVGGIVILAAVVGFGWREPFVIALISPLVLLIVVVSARQRLTISQRELIYCNGFTTRSLPVQRIGTVSTVGSTIFVGDAADRIGIRGPVYRTRGHRRLVDQLQWASDACADGTWDLDTFKVIAEDRS